MVLPEKTSSFPVALVLGAPPVIGKKLAEILSTQNLAVQTAPTPALDPSYVFNFTPKPLPVSGKQLFFKIGSLSADELAVAAPQIATLMFRPGTDGQTFSFGKIGSPKLIFFFSLIILLPLISSFAQVFFSFQVLRSAKNQLEKGQFAAAASSAASSAAGFSAVKNDWRRLPVPGKIYEVLDLGESVSQLLYHAALFGQTSSDLFSSVTDLNRNFDLTSAVSVLKIELDQIITSLDFLTLKYPGLLPPVRQYLSLASRLLPQLPEILGQNSRQTYLVLLQNNTELRPSGGFIGSYALVSFEKGKLLNFKVFDVYSADGQLKGKITPPDEILHFLGQPNWYLRDSNWSPDFSLTAKRAAWFLEKETGQTVDGVIAIDLFLVKKLLAVTGPLKLVDFDDTVSADNFFQKAESQAEINFFPGSTQKRDYLSAASSALFENLTSRHPRQITPLLKALFAGFQEKHLQISFLALPQNENFQNKLFLVEANLGANKANYFLKRNLNVQIDLGKNGEQDTTLAVTYLNTSPGETWPAGRYKNYLRVFLPLNSRFLSASLNDGRTATVSAVLSEKVLKALSPDQFLIHEASESGLTTFGTLLEVPANSSKTFVFKYRPPQNLDYQKSTIPYNFQILKQAGTDSDPLSVVINYPPFLKPEAGLASGQQIRYNTVLSADKVFQILWTRLF